MAKTIYTYWTKLFLDAAKAMWEKLGVWGLLFGLLLSGGYAVYIGEQTFNLEGILVFTKVLLFLVFLAWFVFVFGVAATQDKQKEERVVLLDKKLNSISPNIQLIGQPIVLDDVRMDMNIMENSEIFHVTGVSHMAHVVFVNNPEYITDKNSVTGVRAEITYLDKDKKILFTTQGRWSNSDQPPEISTRGKQVTIESVDFPNNGAHRMLDLLIKYPEDNYVYGYNNDSYDRPYYLHPMLEIKEERFFVQVLLKGAYLPKNVYEFEVFTRGRDDTFEIMNGGKWIRAKSTMAQKVLAKIKISKTRKTTKKKSSLKKTP
jgi:hypothetical protein